MVEKCKKIDRQYVLSDSSVNEYGFRLLTTGYQLEDFRKNPIGYYMHRREDGIVLKWEDLQVTDDTIVGTPVINLSNGRGEQTCAEAENGFLNAASVGHIVVLEYSMDKEMMLPGQTGPTITKWYNKECSLVDIPGNCNALTRLYDAQENELNLADLNIVTPILKSLLPNVINDLRGALELSADADGQTIILKVQELVNKATELHEQHKTLQADNLALKDELAQVNSEAAKAEISTILQRALEDKKITVELSNKLSADYAMNPEGLRSLVAAMPAYRSIAEHLSHRHTDKEEAQWLWDDYEKSDPTGKKLKDLRANDPARYKELFDEKFNAC
jgi:hypothetical protein